MYIYPIYIYHNVYIYICIYIYICLYQIYIYVRNIYIYIYIYIYISHTYHIYNTYISTYHTHIYLQGETNNCRPRKDDMIPFPFNENRFSFFFFVLLQTIY